MIDQIGYITGNVKSIDNNNIIVELEKPITSTGNVQLDGNVFVYRKQVNDFHNLNKDFLPYEIDIELWRRIVINTNHYWKSMGTREAMKSMLLLIGIPEPFIEIKEYIYTVDGKINPSEDPLTINDYPTTSYPYDTDGYPKAPLETNYFYFQISFFACTM